MTAYALDSGPRYLWCFGGHFLVGDGREGERLRHQPVEQQAAVGREAPVEPEGILVKIVGEMLWRHGPLVRAEQPALDEGVDQMNMG